MSQQKRYPADLAREFLLSVDAVIELLAPYFTVIDRTTPISVGTYKLAKPALQRAQTLTNLPLKFWGLKNFKGVRDSAVSFAPLTVIVGQNSAGKSSLIQSLLFFAQSQTVTGASIPLNGPLYRAGLYQDLLNNSCDAQSQSIEFHGRFTTTPLVRSARFSNNYRIDCDYRAVTGAEVGTSTYLSLGSLSLGITDSAGVESKLLVNAVEGNKQAARSLQLFDDLDFDLAEADTDILVAESDQRSGFTAELSTSHGIENLKFRSTHFEGMMPTACIGEFTSVEELALELIFPKGRLRRPSPDASIDLFFHYIEEEFGDYEGAHNKGKQTSEFLDVIQSISVQMLDEDARKDPKVEVRDTGDWRTSRGFDWPLYQTLAVSIDIVLHDFAADDEAGWEEQADHVNALKSQLAQNLMSYAKSKSASEATLKQQRLLEMPRLLGREGYNAMTNFFGRRVLYLGPLRKEPDFSYSQDAVTTPNTPLGMRGENTFWRLTTGLTFAEVHVAGNQGLTRLRLLDATNQWVQKFFGESVTLKIGTQDQHGVSVKFGDQALPHVGVGVSQLLPVIVLCLMAKPGQIVLLEQPELHLHPALQQKLADFLLSMVDSGRQIIVETHSEYLITRLRLRTVQTSANANLFNIVFATNSPEHGTTYTSTQVDSNGSLNTWPEGFFDEATSDLEEMMDIVLNREQK